MTQTTWREEFKEKFARRIFTDEYVDEILVFIETQIAQARKEGAEEMKQKIIGMGVRTTDGQECVLLDMIHAISSL